MLNKRILDGLDLFMPDSSFVNKDPLATLETNILIGQIKYEVEDLKGQKNILSHYYNINSCLDLKHMSILD